MTGDGRIQDQPCGEETCQQVQKGCLEGDLRICRAQGLVAGAQRRGLRAQQGFSGRG